MKLKAPSLRQGADDTGITLAKLPFSGKPHTRLARIQKSMAQTTTLVRDARPNMQRMETVHVAMYR